MTQESKYFLNIVETIVSSPFDVNLKHHGKALRDILDNLEGHLNCCLNSKGRYDHVTLKYDAPYMSKKALALREKTIKSEFVKPTHREHAKPFKYILQEIEGLKGVELLSYIKKNVKSVTILKEEQKALDELYKTEMPDVDNIWSRFEELEIELVKRK